MIPCTSVAASLSWLLLLLALGLALASAFGGISARSVFLIVFVAQESIFNYRALLLAEILAESEELCFLAIASTCRWLLLFLSCYPLSAAT
jgi:hypothetical protein